MVMVDAERRNGGSHTSDRSPSLMRRLESIRLVNGACYQSLQVLFSNAVSGIHVTQRRFLYLLPHKS